MSEPENVHASLAKIQGGVDLIAERLLHANQINDERHSAVREDIRDIRDTQHRHGNRIMALEADKTFRTKGLSMASSAIHWATGGGVVAILAMIARHFGV